MTIEIINCWLLSTNLTVVEIKHALNGLPEGTEFTDGTNSYHIHNRIIFGHTSDLQKSLEHDTTSSCFLSFKGPEEQEASRNHVLHNEAKGIYQYTLKEAVKIKQGEYSIVSTTK